jgi:hypothetical protein
MDQARIDTQDVPFWGAIVTLGRVSEGAIFFSHRIGDKEAALATYEQDREKGATFFLVWTGNYHSDVFAVTPEDVARWVEGRRKK